MKFSLTAKRNSSFLEVSEIIVDLIKKYDYGNYESRISKSVFFFPFFDQSLFLKHYFHLNYIYSFCDQLQKAFGSDLNQILLLGLLITSSKYILIDLYIDRGIIAKNDGSSNLSKSAKNC